IHICPLLRAARARGNGGGRRAHCRLLWGHTGHDTGGPECGYCPECAISQATKEAAARTIGGPREGGVLGDHWLFPVCLFGGLILFRVCSRKRRLKPATTEKPRIVAAGFTLSGPYGTDSYFRHLAGRPCCFSNTVRGGA